MSTEMHQAQFRFIPLRDLAISPLNVRKSGGEEGIDQLADLIDAEGVLQNLNVYEAREDEQIEGHYAVVAGGRRWRALNRLVERHRIEPDYPVPCMVVSYDRAVQISLTENSGREPMHPADEFEAFRQLIDAGQPLEDVAARFGVTPITVQRRLKLANVAPEFIALYRGGKLTLEHLMAFAVTDDPERQRQVWDNLKSYDPDPQTLREQLTEQDVCAGTPIARFVGLKVYRKAGGVERRDLFSEDDEVLLDGQLVRTLATQKLEKYAEKLRSEGAGWVEVHPSFDYATRSTYGRVAIIRREPTAPEQEQIQGLEARLEELEAVDDAGLEADEREALREEKQRAEAEVGALYEQLRVPDPNQQACAGVVVSIGRDGKVQVERNLLRPQDAERFIRERSLSERRTKAKVPRIHSAALVRKLTAQRTLALQAELVQQPRTAVIVLTHRLVLEMFYPRSGMHNSAVCLRPSATDVARHAGELAGTAAGQTLAQFRQRYEDILPDDPDQLLNWLTEQSEADRLMLLAYCVSVVVDGVQSIEGPCSLDAVAKLAKLDMAQWWTATAEGYFGSVSKSQILAVLAESGSASDAASLEKLKKRALAQEAERRLVGKEWLPVLMRTPV